MSKKTITNILILIILTAVTFFVIFKNDFSEIILILKTANYSYIFLAIVFFIFSLFLDSYIITIISHLYKKDYKLSEGFVSRSYCVFFSGITPFASGGEPFQAYAMTKQKLKIEESLGIIFIYFLLYKTILLGIALFSIIYNYQNINTLFDQIEIFSHKYNLLFIIIIGFSIISTLTLGLIFLVYSKLFKKLLIKLIYILSKLKLIKNPNNLEEKIENKISLIKTQNKKLLANKKTLIYLLFLMLIRFLIIYSIPYLCFYGINQPIPISNYFDTICLTSYTSIISGILPSPGGSVGVEFTFQYLFSGFFLNKIQVDDIDIVIKSVLLIWRFITYYFSLIICAIVILIHRSKKIKE